jgi:hypothetical protein
VAVQAKDGAQRCITGAWLRSADFEAGSVPDRVGEVHVVIMPRTSFTLPPNERISCRKERAQPWQPGGFTCCPIP